jgi:hypothetical protein
LNSKAHLTLSFIKSFIRLVGCGFALLHQEWTIAVWAILIAETFGVLEEVKDKR